jgi:hypothetical protein
MLLIKREIKARVTINDDAVWTERNSDGISAVESNR